MSYAVLMTKRQVNTKWRNFPLGEIAEIVNGGTPKSSVSAYWGGDVQWLTPAEMGKMQGRSIAITARTITAEGLARSSAQLVPPHSVIFSTRAPIGHLAINDSPMAFNQGCRGIVPGPMLNHVFLYYFLLLNRRDLDALGTGTTFKELSASSLRSFRISLPPLEEQKRIVAKLDQAFAALDRAHVHAEANLADAKSLFDSMLHAKFSSHADWSVRFLPEISENLDRQRIPITKKDRTPGDIPYYGASGVVDHVADHIFDDDLLLVSEDGANLLARTYPIAFSISGKSWVNNHAHVLRFDDAIAREYIRLYLNSVSLEPYVSGMAQPKLNQASLNKIPIPFPDERERAAIVSAAADMQEQCEALEESYRSQLADIATLRQSLLQQAFSGQLT